MDLLSLLSILVRRWYIFLLVVAITAAGLLYLYPRLKPDYQATGALLLSPPNSQSVLIQNQPTQIPVNPLLLNSTGVLGVATTLASVGGNEAEREYVTAQYRATYTITVDSHAPLITVQGTAPSQTDATGGVTAVLSYLKEQLNVLQNSVGAPPDQLVSARDLYEPDTVIPSNSGRYKTLLILAAVGLLVASSLAFLVDGIAVSLRFRRFLTSSEPRRRRMRVATASPYAVSARMPPGVSNQVDEQLAQGIGPRR